MMKAIPQINDLTRHIFHNYMSSAGAGSMHSQDEKYFRNHVKGFFDHNGQHLGTITLHNAIHSDDPISHSGKFKHVKIHVLDYPDIKVSSAHYAGQAPYYDSVTDTLHTRINISTKAYSPVGSENTFHKGEWLRNTLAHEVSHGLQHIMGPSELISKVGSQSRGTDLVHTRLPDQPLNWPTNLSSRHTKNAQEVTPTQYKTRKKIQKIGEKNPLAVYFHAGHEGQSRVMGKLPRIMDMITQHHSLRDTHDYIQQAVSRIKNESKKFKSPIVARKFLHSSLSKLLDHHTKDFSKKIRTDIERYEPNYSEYDDIELNRLGTPVAKPIQIRKKQLEAKQRKNIILLAQHANEHYVNDIIRQHSDHNVLHARRNPDQLSHETQREINIQGRTRKKPQPIVTPQPETREKQSSPQSLPTRIISKVKSIFQKKKQLNETIVKRGNEECVISKKGKNLGCSSSHAGAVKRLRQVEYFKHMKEENEQEWSATVHYIHPEKGEVSEVVKSKENIRKEVHAFVNKLPKGAEFKKVDYHL